MIQQYSKSVCSKLLNDLLRRKWCKYFYQMYSSFYIPIMNYCLISTIFLILLSTTTFATKKYVPDASLSVVRNKKRKENRLFKVGNIYLFQPKIIKSHGYPSETHIVDTKDGYLLEVHRIPHGIDKQKFRNFPVLLQHGVVASSADWILNGPSKALGKFLSIIYIPNNTFYN